MCDFLILFSGLPRMGHSFAKRSGEAACKREGVAGEKPSTRQRHYAPTLSGGAKYVG